MPKSAMSAARAQIRAQIQMLDAQWQRSYADHLLNGHNHRDSRLHCYVGLRQVESAAQACPIFKTVLAEIDDQIATELEVATTDQAIRDLTES